MAKKDGKESTIGKVIYGFLMFAPLIAVGTSCAYSIFNKNAVADNQSTNKINYTNISNVNELVIGQEYCFNSAIQKVVNTSGQKNINVYCSNFNFLNTNSPNLNNGNVTRFTIYILNNTSNIAIYTYDDMNNNIGAVTVGEVSEMTFTFNYNGIPNSDLTNYTYAAHLFYTREVSNTSNRLINTFYYSLDRVQEEDVFKWAKNNEIYTGLKAVTDGLTIETEFIPMILSYWLIISLIYFMYDILLIIFHILHTNIHKLEQI